MDPDPEPSFFTYEQAWADYAAGRMSTVVMIRLLRTDEVFARWALRRANAMIARKRKTIPIREVLTNVDD
jgi:hypothetical protein